VAEVGEYRQYPAVRVAGVWDAHFLEDAAHVGFDSAFGEEEPAGDGGVGLSFCDEG